MSAPVSPVLTSPVSRAVETKIRQHLEAPRQFTERLYEFDGFQYLLRGSADGGLSLSFALPLLGQWAHTLVEALRPMITNLFSGIATIQDPPEPGFQMTLKIDMRFLARTGEQESCIKSLASMRLHVVGAPLRRHFMELAKGSIHTGPVEEHCSKPGQMYYVKPQSDSVVVVLPMRFVSNQDAAIGHAFLQEFVEARRSSSQLGMSPTCSYHPAKSPPAELQGIISPLGTEPRGYMRFTFTRRHVAGQQMEMVLWSCCTARHVLPPNPPLPPWHRHLLQYFRDVTPVQHRWVWAALAKPPLQRMQGIGYRRQTLYQTQILIGLGRENQLQHLPMLNMQWRYEL